MSCIRHLNIPIPKILNLGCGNQTYGTYRVDILPTSTTTHVFDIEKSIQFPDNFFDEVYSKNLLEHLRNVGFHLEECYRVLKKGGKLILITDNVSCRRYYTFGTHEGRYEKQHKKNPKDKHYAIFTKTHLQNHLEHAGFKNIKISFIGTDTIGRFLDKITKQFPRIQVEAIK